MALALLFVTAWLPFSLRMAVGALLGRLTWLVARERRYITEVNIRLCFPELDKAAQAALVRKCFVENGIGLIETATGWMRPPSHFRDLVILSGTEHMDAALAEGRGVLLLGAHFTTLDFTANLLGVPYPFGVTYRPHRNPLFDALMLRGRLRNCNGVFDRHDVRGALRHLKQGKILWYAPDQDYGPHSAVFALFFGCPAATITATTRFATFNNSPVLMLRHHRLSEKHKYVLEFLPLPPPFPSGDEVSDANVVNQMVEACIRMEPAQYLWMHKRFKTQRGGKSQSPYVFVSTRQRRLNDTLYRRLTEGSQPTARSDRLLLQGGLELWTYAGMPGRLRGRGHPLRVLDRYSKQLRSAGVPTVTLDSVFLFTGQQRSGATCHVPHGEPLTADSSLSPARAAQFLARLHTAGFHFRQAQDGNLLVHNNRLAILDPLLLDSVREVKSGPRLRDLNRLMEQAGFGPAQQAQCQQEYLQQSAQAVQRGLLPAPRPTRLEG